MPHPGPLVQEERTTGRRGRALARAGLAEEERGEVFHPSPERAEVEARVIREEVVPEVLADLAHGGARARQRLIDEVEGATELEEEREVAVRFFAGEAGADEEREDVVREGDAEGAVAGGALLEDERVELAHEAVEHLEQQRVLEEGSVVAGRPREIEEPVPSPLGQRGEVGRDAEEGPGEVGARARALRFIFPLHFGHSSTSTPKVRLSSSAQGR